MHVHAELDAGHVRTVVDPDSPSSRTTGRLHRNGSERAMVETEAFEVDEAQECRLLATQSAAIPWMRKQGLGPGRLSPLAQKQQRGSMRGSLSPRTNGERIAVAGPDERTADEAGAGRPALPRPGSGRAGERRIAGAIAVWL